MNPLTTYFTNSLEALGYTGLSLCWDTRDSQLEGPAFYGELTSSLASLMTRFLKETNPSATLYQKLVQRKRLSDLMELVDIGQTFGSRGFGAIKIDCTNRLLENQPTSMVVEHIFRDQDELLLIIQDDSTTPDADTYRVHATYPLFSDFVCWLESDIRAVSKKLAEEGNRLMPEPPADEYRYVWTFDTHQLAVTAVAQKVGVFAASKHAEIPFEELQALACGNGYLYNLSVHVDFDNGEIGCSSMHNLYSTSTFDSITGREEGRLATLVYDALVQAREHFA